SGTHEVEIFWHFAPECRVEYVNGRVAAERDGLRLEIDPPDMLSVSLARGRTAADGDGRPLGWFSSGFDLKVPATAVVFAGRIRGDTRLESRLRIPRGRSPAA
ncbi:MAG TPA: hypothetical protein VHE11_14600, partial [Steroidobacteraceae bacterium]|nr:hypothetical protein [Steroidobacteraceae bacterium]